MNASRLLVLTLLLFLAPFATADPVDESQVTAFQAGQPACADDVNATIQALITAVNDNAARVAELEAALRNAHRPLQDLVSGSTYQIFSQAIAMGETSKNVPENDPGTPIVSFTQGALGLWGFAELGTMVLNDNGTVSYAFDGHEREIYIDTFASHDVDSPSFPNIDRVDFDTPLDEGEIGTTTGTWSLNGQTLTLNLDEESFNFLVSPDGETLMAGTKRMQNIVSGGGPLALFETEMTLGVRTNPPNIFVETFDGTPYPNNGPTIDFDAPFNESVFRSVRVINLGDSDLTNMSLDLQPFEGPGQIYEIVKGLDGPTLGPGEQALITIRFTDTSGGNAFANLDIDSDDPDTPTFRVNLRGF